MLALVGAAVAVVTPAGAAPVPVAPSGRPAAAPAPAHPTTFADRSPIGSLDTLHEVPGGAHLVGWDFDPSHVRTVLDTYVTVDHVWAKSVRSNLVRPDVGAAHANAGPRHGFDFTIPVPEGQRLICVSAKNIGKGHNTLLGCVRRTFDYGPYGALDTVATTPGRVHVRGWAVDNDSPTAPVVTSVSVDGVAHVLTADLPRPDVAAAHPKAGPDHGFDVSFRVAQGPHTVCVTTTNIGYGSDNSFGCRSVTLNDSPTVGIDQVAQSGGHLLVRGWAFDPDRPTVALTATVGIDGQAHQLTANGSRPDVAAAYPGVGAAHGFQHTYSITEGQHRVCVRIHNVGFGSDVTPPCRSVTLDFTPTAVLSTLAATATGLSVTGWATDPDSAGTVPVRLTVDGHVAQTIPANQTVPGITQAGHAFAAALQAKSGRHAVCATALNIGYGTHDSAPACQKITLALAPLGAFESLKRDPASGGLTVTGWAFDPDTSAALAIEVSVDGAAAPDLTADAARPDIAARYPGLGTAHGIASVLAADAGEHTVCLTARNVGGGTDLSLGCKLVIAANPTPPSAPRKVRATGGYGAATVSWQAPTSDGGAPWTAYTVTASPGGKTVRVAPTATTATVTGLAQKTAYTFTVTAVNVAGTSPAGSSPSITTLAGPPPQTSPAPISTSRYTRNLSTGSAAEQATMRKEGAADARSNPAGHRYLVLLDIGGQDQYDGGVVLSAGIRFVSYSALVRDVNAYVDGYHSAQRSGAPATIALGTNNDMDVSYASGRTWASTVVQPVVAHARGYTGLTIAGANDIEPGFRASYSATRSWVSGYLANTSAPFVFNGSADGCAWSVPNRTCNNGWTMSGLYWLAGGIAPGRVINLPQVYNSTMSAQWKWISLTGIVNGHPRITFGGVLTEYTACAQAGSCGSMTGQTAWSVMWSNLQSDPRLRVGSLPYATDLRIDW